MVIAGQLYEKIGVRAARRGTLASMHPSIMKGNVNAGRSGH